MRRINTILIQIIFILLALHGVIGSLLLLGWSTTSVNALAYCLLVVVLAHAAVGVYLSLRSVKAGLNTGKWYTGKNAELWIKRLSGLGILILIFFHMNVYTTVVDGHFALKEFTALRMLGQILFIAMIFIHIFISIKGFLISKGVMKLKKRKIDAMLVATVFLLLFVIAVVSYYIQWNF